MPLPNSEKLYCLSTVFNPLRYGSRYKLYNEFAQRINSQPNCELWTTEIAYAHRDFCVTDANNPRHLQLRADTEVWHKEQSLNLLIERLPKDWHYVLFADADIAFMNPNWSYEIMQALQHWRIVQPFNVWYDLDTEYKVYNKGYGFVYAYRNNIKVNSINANDEYSYTYGGHPGFCLAMTRRAFDNVGGLISHAALGSADRHMMLSLIGKAEESYNEGVVQSYKDPILMFQEQCKEYIKDKFYYLNSGLQHFFHGKKRDRKYGDRWKILVDNQFNPDLDLKRNWHGLYELTDHNPRLKVEFYEYFKGRQEDSIDVQ